MAIELHHLQPSHDDEMYRLKARIAELEALNHDLCERVTENDDIRLHWEEIEQTRADNEMMKVRIAKLEEERRWRKFPDEKPECEGDYLVMARYSDDDELHIEICLYESGCEDFGHYERRYSGSGDSFGGYDGEEWVTHNVSFWLPLPSAPKEEK